MSKILVIDDDRVACELLSEIFDDQGWETVIAQTPQQAKNLVEKEKFDLVISDINLQSSISGMDLLRSFRQQVPVILITAFGSLETSLEARREGAWDLLSKPFNVQDVISIAGRAIKSRKEEKIEVNKKTSLDKWLEARIVGRSPAMISLFNEIARVSPTQTTVLIIGESGTGKELIARAIHENSPKANGAFVAINCGAITETLLEAELFGHVKGSFTGANTDRIGLFEMANQGTLFLDEIGETSLAMQVKLLRVLQEREIRRVGSIKPIKVDVRVIAATNRDLETEVKDNRFREDLFYRLSVVTLKVPSLRERQTDISLLANKFLAKYATNLKKQMSWSNAALTALTAYNWPGNVRELENVVEATALNARDNIIEITDLPVKISSITSALPKRSQSEISNLFADLPTLDELEKRYLLHVLSIVKHNRSRAAEVMGIDRRTLYRMAERFSINLDES